MTKYEIEVISGRRDGTIKLEIQLDLLRQIQDYFDEAEQSNFIGEHHEDLKSAIQKAVEQAELGGAKSSKRRDIDWDMRDSD